MFIFCQQINICTKITFCYQPNRICLSVMTNILFYVYGPIIAHSERQLSVLHYTTNFIQTQWVGSMGENSGKPPPTQRVIFMYK